MNKLHFWADLPVANLQTYKIDNVNQKYISNN